MSEKRESDAIRAIERTHPWQHRATCRCEWCSAEARFPTDGGPTVIQRDTMQYMKNDRLFSLRLPSDVLDRLEQIAEDEDRTIADVVRRALREYLDAR